MRKLSEGIPIAFGQIGSKDRSQLIVKIVESDMQIFETKMRAPYKIVVETIE